MALTTRNGLQFENRFPNLETIVERGKQWSWAEWKNSVHPVEGANELPLPPSIAWHFASIIKGFFQNCQDFEADVKQALLASPFFSWYADLPDGDPELENYKRQGINPLQHRLACLFLAKLLRGFKIEKGECVFYGKTVVRLGKEVTKSLIVEDQMETELSTISAAEFDEIEQELLEPGTPDFNTKAKRICIGILNLTCSIINIQKLPLSEEERIAIMKLLTFS
jgi:hypothetical protein